MHPIIDPFVKYIGKSSVDTTSWSFKLVCRLNVFLLLSFVAFLSATQFFGESIDCVASGGSHISKSTIDSYCWIMGVYTQKGFIGSLNPSVMHFGWNGKNYWDYGEKHFLRYYQWISIVLMLMALSYGFPYFLWKKLEGGRLDGICNGLKQPIHAKFWDAEKRSNLIAYLMAGRSTEDHYWYAVKYFMCQVIVVVICLGNLWFIDAIFGGFWIKFMPAITSLYSFDYYTYTNHTSQIFPRMAKCQYYSYGASGSIQHIDALCSLPLNILNEKLFTFLYIWLLVLVVVAVVDLFHAVIMGVSGYCRVRKLANLTIRRSFDEALRATDNGRRGDFFMLYMIGKNLYPYAFSDLITELAIVRKVRSPSKEV